MDWFNPSFPTADELLLSHRKAVEKNERERVSRVKIIVVSCSFIDRPMASRLVSHHRESFRIFSLLEYLKKNLETSLC